MTIKRGELESAICEDFYLGICGMYLYASVDHGKSERYLYDSPSLSGRYSSQTVVRTVLNFR
jgi:hypothetical protein